MELQRHDRAGDLHGAQGQKRRQPEHDVDDQDHDHRILDLLDELELPPLHHGTSTPPGTSGPCDGGIIGQAWPQAPGGPVSETKRRMILVLGTIGLSLVWDLAAALLEWGPWAAYAMTAILLVIFGGYALTSIGLKF